VLPWLAALVGALKADFRGVVVGTGLAALLSAAVARRRGSRVAVAFAFATAALSIVALVIAFNVWVPIECGGPGFDAKRLAQSGVPDDPPDPNARVVICLYAGN
jgi:hypothetical protein